MQISRIFVTHITEHISLQRSPRTPAILEMSCPSKLMSKDRLLAHSQQEQTIFTFNLVFMLQFIPYFLKTLRSAVSKVKDCQRAHVCQRSHSVFALYLYGGLVKDCRVGLS